MKKKKINVIHVDSIENTLHQMPKYNPYMGGYGVHKSTKYPSRAKRKHDFQKQLRSSGF